LLEKRPKLDSQTLPKTRKKGGRPRLQDSTTLTPEMEQVAQMTYQGFSPEEIAESLQVPTTKVLLYLEETPIVQARVRNLFGDKQELWTKKRYELYETCIDTAVKLIKEGKVPWKFLYDLLKDFDEEYGFMKRVQKERKLLKKTTQEEDKKETFEMQQEQWLLKDGGEE